MTNFPRPVLGFAAYSGTGKTTLLIKLLPLLYKKDRSIIAIASDRPLGIEVLPQLDINNPAQIAQYIKGWLAAGAKQELTDDDGSER